MGSFFENLIELWSKFYFIEPILICSAGYSLIQISKGNYSFPFRRYFLLYTGSVTLLFIAGALILVGDLNISLKSKYIELANCGFNIIEMYCFSQFFICVLHSERAKKNISKISIFIIILNSTSFIVLLFSPFFKGFYNYTDLLCAINFFFLMGPCILYFLEIYIQNNRLHWSTSVVVIFLFTYCVVSLPSLVVLENFRRQYDFMMILLFVPHLLFLSLLCLTMGTLGKNFSVSRLI